MHCAFIDNHYNFEAALTRILMSVELGRTSIKRCVNNEIILYKSYKVKLPERIQTAVQVQRDLITVELLRQFHPYMLSSYVPLKVVCDGNCLYRAVSRALYGSEVHHLHIRFLAAIEIAVFKKYYDPTYHEFHDLVKDSRLITDKYPELLKSVCTPGEYSDFLILFVVSAALKVAFQSYCPPISDCMFPSELVSRTVHGRSVMSAMGPEFTIMWTMMRVVKDPKDFRPNHFVVLQKLDEPQQGDINETESRVTVQDLELAKAFVPTKPQCRSRVPSSMEMVIPKTSFIHRTTSIPLKSSVLEITEDATSNMSVTSESNAPVSLNASSDYVTNRLSYSKESRYSSESVGEDTMTDPESSSCNEERQQQRAEGGKDLPLGKRMVRDFLTLNEVIHALTQADETLVPLFVPRGVKENVYFVVQNGHNVEKRKKGEKAEFWDDCGAWAKGGPTNRYYYLCQPSSRLCVMIKKNNLYCIKREHKKKRTYEPLNPQPSECNVLELHRRYSKHTLSSDYMRRITWIEVENDVQKLACYEYKGMFPGNAPHGKATNPLAMDYIRTKDIVLDEMKNQLKTQKARTVYRNADIIDGPRAEKQVRDLQYRQRQKEYPQSTSLGIFAEQMVRLEEHQAASSFVQVLVRRHGKVPCAILYKQEQMADLRRFCCSAPSAQTTILGVDKTFNLGDVHVTTTVYKYLAVCRRDTGEHPIMPGPIFLHGNSDQETYFVFFQHLAGALYDAPSSPTLGSDEEKAIRLAFAQAFPGAAMMCCTRHLKKNVIDYLKDKVGVSHKVRQCIMQIFSSDGVLGSHDMVTLDCKIENAMELINNSAPGFSAYFSNRIAPILRENMKACMSLSLTKITMEWTNNNSESYNHVLKQLVDWKSLKLTDLVVKLESEIDALYTEIKRAFLNMGNFVLDKQYAEFSIERDVWCSMSIEKQKRYFDKFLKKIKEVESRNSRTKDGNRIALTPKHRGKKPNQRKRGNRERTTTTKNKIIQH